MQVTDLSPLMRHTLFFESCGIKTKDPEILAILGREAKQIDEHLTKDKQ